MPGQDKGKKKLLGEYLLDSGLVSKDQIKKALEEQKKAGMRLGQTLIELGYLKEEDLIVILAKQLDLPHIDIANYILKPQVAELIPENVSRRYEMIALDKAGNTLTVAMVDPLNVFAIDEVQHLTQCRIEPVICARSALIKVLTDFYQKTSVRPKPEIPSTATSGATASVEVKDKEAGPVAYGQEIIELVNNLVTSAVEERATDIHIEPDEEELRVRCRVDGFLRELKVLPKEVQLPVISRVKVMAGLDISEKRIPQDGRIQFEYKEKKVDLRVSSLPTVLGEKIVMRVLDKSLIVVDLDKLGFLPENLKHFKELIKRPYGMILVTGPTSSGKTTTLYSALNYINTMEKNILTVEDPVEYRLRRINQVQVNPKAGLTFAAGLRAFLRQDPNVIMIGEIRDLETAEIAVQSALTGHLVFSTVHTNDAPSTVTRLIDMKVEGFLVSSAVSGILAQRLIRTICLDCKVPYAASPELVTSLGFTPSERGYTFYKGKGCSACKGTGYKGRVGIFELMLINDAIRELILQNASTAVLKEKARQNGMHTLREDGMQKVLLGDTSVEEVLRATAEEAKG